MLIGAVLFSVISAGFVVQGFRLLRNREGWGIHFVEDTVPKVFRIGEPDTHRKILGAAWLVLGVAFVGIGMAIIATTA